MFVSNSRFQTHRFGLTPSQTLRQNQNYSDICGKINDSWRIQGGICVKVTGTTVIVMLSLLLLFTCDISCTSVALSCEDFCFIEILQALGRVFEEELWGASEGFVCRFQKTFLTFCFFSVSLSGSQGSWRGLMGSQGAFRLLLVCFWSFKKVSKLHTRVYRLLAIPWSFSSHTPLTWGNRENKERACSSWRRQLCISAMKRSDKADKYLFCHDDAAEFVLEE